MCNTSASRKIGRVIFALLVVVICSSGTRAQTAVAVVVNPANGVRYHLLTPSTWSAAKTFALSNGWRIVTVNDAAENEWLRSTFANLNGIVHPEIWIGINDQSTECQFVWDSGQPVTFTNWQANWVPCTAAEDYGVLHTGTGAWNDTVNDTNAAFGTSVAAVLEEPNAVSLAACCSPLTGVCFVTTGGVCTSLGMEFRPTMAACLVTTCPLPQQGACCLGSVCQVTPTGGCSQRFLGVGSVCHPLVCCPANFDADSNLNVQDIFAFIAAWFAGCP